jgi:ribose transport system permease protein
MAVLLSRYRGLAGLLVTWLAVLAIFHFWVPSGFVSRDNLETILRQAAIVGFGAVGMTFIIVSRAIDLSVGSIVAFSTVVIAWLVDRGIDPLLAAAFGIAAGSLCGALNGQLITRFRVNAFIVTLGTMLIIRGVAKGLADEKKIDAPMTWLATLLKKLPEPDRWMLVPVGVWLLLVVALLASFVLEKAVFGRNVVAVGSNEEAARLSGIDLGSVRRWVFVIGGTMAGLAGLMQFSRLTVGDPTVAIGLELEVIAAVVIGGGSLAGGEGSISGSLFGALIMATIRAGSSQAGLPNWVQEIVTGSIIVIAVAIDRLRAARHAGSAT